MLYLTLYLGLSGLTAYLFYHSSYGMLCAFVIVPFCMTQKKKELHRRRKQQLMIQFKDSLHLLSGALAAGYSMENAWKEAERDLIKMYGKQADMCRELIYINTCVELHEPMEKLLLEFAVSSGIEDINVFCQIFAFAKRSGGDFIKIIQNTERRIRDKAEIIQEIETVMAAKRMEQKIMNTVPFALLFGIQLSSSEFMKPLYGNVLGIAVMSGCMVLYGIAIRIAQRIVDIEV